MRNITYPYAVLACSLVLTAHATEDWPMFRGPNGSGVSETGRPPQEFGPDQNVSWKIEVPWSPSSPSVVGGRIFLGTFADGKLETRAYAASDGKSLWTGKVTASELEGFHRTDGSPASATPATDGKYVVNYFGSFGVVTYDFDGKELWRHAMPVAKTTGGYGSGTSPLIVGDSVVVLRDMAANSSLFCFDLKNGKLRWEVARPEASSSFGTPIVWRNGETEEIITPGTLFLKGYDVKSGKGNWLVSGVTHIACTTPVVGDGMLYFAGWGPGKQDKPWLPWDQMLEARDKNKDGVIDEEDVGPEVWSYLKGLDMDFDGKLTKSDFDRLNEITARGQNLLLALKPGCKGEAAESNIAWKATKGLPYVPSPLFYQGRIYLVRDGGIVSCYEAKTGDAIWEQNRLPASGNYYASPIAADGRIFVVSLDGKMTVLKAGSPTPEILRSIDFGERIAATPAIVGERIYIRTESKLYAFGRRQLAKATP